MSEAGDKNTRDAKRKKNLKRWLIIAVVFSLIAGIGATIIFVNALFDPEGEIIASRLELWWIIPLAFLGGIAFGSVGMFFTSLVKTIEMYNLPIFLFVTPMFVFSGTFFPLENLPLWAQKLATLFPLTHLVKLTRSFSLGLIRADLLWNLAYLLIFCLIFFPLAVFRMHRRLIK